MTAPSEARSRTMRAVKSKDTQPERKVRRLLFRLGYRFRLHVAMLPGAPDVVFTARKKVIFIHGCFWHGHDCARGARQPKTNADYWRAKIERNRNRDARHLLDLAAAGWSSLVVWECTLKDETALAEALQAYLGPLRCTK